MLVITIIVVAILVISAVTAEFTEKVNFQKAEVHKLYSRLERVSHSSRGRDTTCLPNCSLCVEDQRIWECEEQYSYIPLAHEVKSPQEVEEAYNQAYLESSDEYLLFLLKNVEYIRC